MDRIDNPDEVYERACAAFSQGGEEIAQHLSPLTRASAETRDALTQWANATDPRK